MDSLLRSRYTIMAQQNKALIAPVGFAWHRLRDLQGAIELYQADESHPSAAGSYAAACTFYSVLFKADPAALTFDGGLSPAEAAAIRQIVKGYVYDSLSKWHAYLAAVPLPVATFTATIAGRQVRFGNTSVRAARYTWDFGDGKGDTAAAPVHLYAADGSYNVRLTAYNCDAKTDTETRKIVIGPSGIAGPQARQPLKVYPNPATTAVQLLIPDHAERLALINAQGLLVQTLSVQGKKTAAMDVARLPAGTYVLELRLQDGRIIREKLCIVH